MLDWINWQVAQSLIRNLLQWAAGYFVAAGTITSDEASQISGLILGAVALIFSMVSARTKKKALDASKPFTGGSSLSGH